MKLSITYSIVIVDPTVQSVKDLINCSSDLSNFSDLRRIAKLLVKKKHERFGHEGICYCWLMLIF